MKQDKDWVREDQLIGSQWGIWDDSTVIECGVNKKPCIL